MKRTAERIKKELPELRAEVTRTQEMGDLSENAAYQEAKHTLRRKQSQLERIEEELKQVIEIQTSGNEQVQLGSQVTVLFGNEEKIFEMVGEQEANPFKNRISHKSPLGAQLVGKKTGDQFEFGPKSIVVIVKTIK